MKKIYLEGKTVKEINKDFYEKDLNDAYKGIITKPIDNNTPPAYGIKFPKLAFWHSFIATRDEYKKFFVTLPKNIVESNKGGVGGNRSASSSSSTANKVDKAEPKERKPRKYNLKDYKKAQLKDDIKNIKGDIDEKEVEKSIRKRFGKDDPEASFIVKYLSPIMTVAADRVHLSEEIKDFVEDEKINGKSSNDKYMLTRFWKQNPDLREFYAQSITDTMEMFEEVFGGGGVIPINSDLEVVTADKQNQKVIDYVLPEFVELLDYTQSIVPNRNARYAEHDRLQELWTEHFNERYPENSDADIIEYDEELARELAGVKALNPNFSPVGIDELKNEDINPVGILFTDRSGNTVSMLDSEIDESYKLIMMAQAGLFPEAYAKNYMAYMTSSDVADEKYKLSWSTAPLRDLEAEDNRFMQKEEMIQKSLSNEMNFYDKNVIASYAASAAMSDVLVANGFMKPVVYMFKPYEYNFLAGHIFKSEELRQMNEIICSNKNDVNALYNSYMKPLSTSEKQKIAQILMEALAKFDKKRFDTLSSSTQPEVSETIDLLKDIVKYSKTYKKMTKEEYIKILDKYPYARTLLIENIPDEYKQHKAEEFFEKTIVETLALSRKMVRMLDEEHFGKKK